jgi:Do/DeqQ family serine protease
MMNGSDRRILGAALTLSLLAACAPAVEPGSGFAPLRMFEFQQALANDPVEQSDRLADLTATVSDSVVSIATVGTSSQSSPYEQFFGMAPQPSRGIGSGVIVSGDGVILTNHHVIAGASEILVRTNDGAEYAARLVGSDAPTDIAVLRVDDASGLRAMSLGDSERVRAGELVLAIGNPFGLSSSVSLGIISAVGRRGMGITDYENFIQTDAAINPGNSGGALVNMRGELVGINTAIASRTGGSNGVGFAIPVDMAQDIMRQLIDSGRVSRGWLGVGIRDVSATAGSLNSGAPGTGVEVTMLEPKSPASLAGLQSGDIVTAIDGQPVNSADELRTRIADMGGSTTVTLTVRRGTESLDVPVTLGERPELGGR